MAVNSITNVLSYLTVLLVVSACAKTPETIQISSQPIQTPVLVLPPVDEINTREVDFVIISPDNIDRVFRETQEQGNQPVFFALTVYGYENLSLNFNDIRTLVQQQQTIIAAYERFQTQTSAAIEKHNNSLKSQ